MYESCDEGSELEYEDLDDLHVALLYHVCSSMLMYLDLLDMRLDKSSTDTSDARRNATKVLNYAKKGDREALKKFVIINEVEIAKDGDLSTEGFWHDAIVF